MTRVFRAARRARGVAAITALLVVAVAAATAAFMLAQKSALLDQTLLVASRAQADLYAQAGIDWARGILAQDARNAGSVDSLDEGWAQPIAALPVERAVVSGAIADEQGRFNLNNVVRGVQRSDTDVQALRRLLESVDLPPELADAILDWVDPDADPAGPGGAEDGYYLAQDPPYRAANQPFVQVEELYRVRGFDAKRIARLRPLVTALPDRTKVNINTAPEEVVAAWLVPALTREKVHALLARRTTKPFRSLAEVADRAGTGVAGLLEPNFDVKSAWYTARVAVAQDGVQVASEALIRRDPSGSTAIIWRRPLY
jgi:general secretion pathway protein K